MNAPAKLLYKLQLFRKRGIHMSWYWRMKPRSIIRTINWFPYFGALEGQNWNQTSGQISCFTKKHVCPVRRDYIYYAHSEEDTWLSGISYTDYLSGSKDQKETESNGRNDKSTFEFFGFGYVAKDGIIHVTQAGRQIMQGNFDQEHYLKQLLKLRLPNQVQKIKEKGNDVGIFPMELVLRAFEKFESLNRSELALLFGCVRKTELHSMLHAIEDFKIQYEALENKLDTKKVKQLFQSVYKAHYGDLENQVNSYYDYAEALSRSLVYTGLFEISGRSLASKIRVAKHAQKKVELLQKNFLFSYPENVKTIEAYMDWYGNLANITLPWENLDERKEIVKDKIAMLHSLLSEAPDEDYQQTAFVSQEELDRLLLHTQTTTNVSDLKDMEQRVSNAITNHNEDYFIKVASKTKKERDFILDKFDDILSNDDMSALWLEVNTWKSFLAIQGTHQVKRNFKIEDDLSPRSFAPGVGNTPDMELYFEDIILLPEVSLMTGVKQWEHEASSVIDHVLHFIEKEPEKKVFGLFLSSRIHLRTMWQFFILNKESWLGRNIPVIPLTIKQYMCIIKHCYENEKTIEELLSFLLHVSDLTRSLSSYQDWEKEIENSIKNFVTPLS